MKSSIRVEASYETDIDDVWEACTQPDRLARWIAEVEGDLRLGGEFRARFTSGWEGTGRVEVCEPPHRLVVLTREEGEADECVIEATLSTSGDQTILVVEERGLPVGALPSYRAGWQVHLEDLGAHLGGGERCDMRTRWEELMSAPSRRQAEPDHPARPPRRPRPADAPHPATQNARYDGDDLNVRREAFRKFSRSSSPLTDMRLSIINCEF